MLLLACRKCSWVVLLCLKQQLAHRLTLQDGGFPVAVSEAWKAEMLIVKILRYSSHRNLQENLSRGLCVMKYLLFNVETLENTV